MYQFTNIILHNQLKLSIDIITLVNCYIDKLIIKVPKGRFNPG